MRFPPRSSNLNAEISPLIIGFQALFRNLNNHNRTMKEEEGFHFMPDVIPLEWEPSAYTLKVAKDIWHHMLVKFTTTEVTYSSVSHPHYVCRLPLQSDEDAAELALRNFRLVRRFHILLWNQCFDRIDWEYISAPPGEVRALGQSYSLLSSFLALDKPSLNISIVGDNLPHGMFGKVPYLLHGFTFNVEKGNFTAKGDAFAMVKTICEAENWRDTMTFNFGISRMSYKGRELIERVEPAILSLTFPQLSDKKLFYHLVRLLKHTETMLEIRIASFEVPGETEFHLPRGNLSLSIESISPESRLVLSCDEELVSLTLSASAAERISTTGMRINTLEAGEGDQERDSGESHSDDQHARKKRKQ